MKFQVPEGCGIFFGCLLSIPLWGIIGLIIWLVIK